MHMLCPADEVHLRRPIALKRAVSDFLVLDILIV